MTFLIGYVLGAVSAFLILGLLVMAKEGNRVQEAFDDGYCPTCFRILDKKENQGENAADSTDHHTVV